MSFTITLVIVIITCLVSYLAFNNPVLKSKLVHHPYSVNHNKEYYRWITSGLIHRDWIHLGINMFVFYQFGKMVELVFASADFFGPVTGPIIYLLFYIVAIMASDLPFFAKYKNDPSRASAGASGAVSAILFAYMMFFPWVKMYLYGIIPIYSIVAGILYLAYETYAQNKNKVGDSTNHLAHIFGAVFGILGLIAIKPTMALVYLNNILQGPVAY